jgi:N-methylhydantoinase A
MSKVGARTVLCPTNVGVASALGLLQAPRTDERTVTNMIALDELTAEEIKLRLAELHDALKAGRDWSTATETHYYLNMRLRGQGYDVRVLVPDVVSIRDVHAAFRAEYTRLFGRPPSDAGQVEIVDWMVRLIEPRGLDADLAGITASQTQDGKHVSPDVRPVYWGPAHGWQDTAVYRRVGIAPRDVVRGPAIIEEDTSTVLIRPEHAASIDDRLTIMVERA